MKQEGFGGLGNVGDLMKQAQKMQKEIMNVQDGLKDKIVQGTAGGGMVVATMNGAKQLVAVKLEKEVVDPADVEMLEDLIVAAVSDALKRAEKLSEQEMKRVTGGLPLPGLF